nr:hypothetical protein [Tanacetum cinerariifolium]
VTFLNNVPEGSYVALISMNRLRYAAFPATVRTALTKLLGSQLAASGQLRNGEPWALLAKKFAAGGTLVREQGPDRTLAQASYNQLVSLVDTVRAPGQAGKVLSTRIGPATEWQTLFNVIKRENTTSSYTLRVLGIDANNNIGGIDFGAPLVTRIDLLNASGVAVKSATFTAPSILKAGERMTVQVSLDVVGVFGTLTPVVTVNPLTNRQPEYGNVPPILDVAVDGRHLLNGDLVSPTPAISIQLKDEDKLRHIKDVSAFTVLLQKPGQTTPSLVNTIGNSEIQFTVDSTSQSGS